MSDEVVRDDLRVLVKEVVVEDLRVLDRDVEAQLVLAKLRYHVQRSVRG